MFTFKELRMDFASAGFGEAMLPLTMVAPAKEMNIPMRHILAIVQSRMIQLIFLALILMFPKIVLWLPTYFNGQ